MGGQGLVRDDYQLPPRMSIHIGHPIPSDQSDWDKTEYMHI